jgi:hypothetical protein
MSDTDESGEDSAETDEGDSGVDGPGTDPGTEGTDTGTSGGDDDPDSEGLTVDDVHAGDAQSGVGDQSGVDDSSSLGLGDIHSEDNAPADTTSGLLGELTQEDIDSVVAALASVDVDIGAAFSDPGAALSVDAATAAQIAGVDMGPDIGSMFSLVMDDIVAEMQQDFQPAGLSYAPQNPEDPAEANPIAPEAPFVGQLVADPGAGNAVGLGGFLAEGFTFNQAVDTFNQASQFEQETQGFFNDFMNELAEVDPSVANSVAGGGTNTNAMSFGESFDAAFIANAHNNISSQAATAATTNATGIEGTNDDLGFAEEEAEAAVDEGDSLGPSDVGVDTGFSMAEGTSSFQEQADALEVAEALGADPAAAQAAMDAQAEANAPDADATLGVDDISFSVTAPGESPQGLEEIGPETNVGLAPTGPDLTDEAEAASADAFDESVEDDAVSGMEAAFANQDDFETFEEFDEFVDAQIMGGNTFGEFDTADNISNAFNTTQGTLGTIGEEDVGDPTQDQMDSFAEAVGLKGEAKDDFFELAKELDQPRGFFQSPGPLVSLAESKGSLANMASGLSIGGLMTVALLDEIIGYFTTGVLGVQASTTVMNALDVPYFSQSKGSLNESNLAGVTASVPNTGGIFGSMVIGENPEGGYGITHNPSSLQEAAQQANADINAGVPNNIAMQGFFGTLLGPIVDIFTAPQGPAGPAEDDESEDID